MIDTTATPGRATWRGQCPTAGCPHQVVATRIRDTAIAPPPPPEPAPPSGGRTKRKVVRDGPYRTDVQQPPGVRRTERPAAGGDPDEHDYRDAVDATDEQPRGRRPADDRSRQERPPGRVPARGPKPDDRPAPTERPRRRATPWDHLY